MEDIDSSSMGLWGHGLKSGKQHSFLHPALRFSKSDWSFCRQEPQELLTEENRT